MSKRTPCVCTVDPYTDMCMKHARLFSAAPDLLEALKIAQTWVDGDRAMEIVMAAIAKAE